MSKIKQNIGKLHLYLLAGLIIIFFGILFLTTAFKDVKMEYKFQEQITTTNEDFVIGELTITNNGPITTKPEFKKLIACQFGDNSDDVSIRYKNKNLRGSSFYSLKNYELGPKKTETITLEINHYFKRTYNPETKEDEIIKKSEYLDIFIFEAEEDDYEYNFCTSAQKKDAIANIDVEIK